MNSNRPLTAGELSLLLDPEAATKVGIPLDTHLPMRWQNLQNMDRAVDLIQDQEKHFVKPTKLLADFKETPLLEVVNLPALMQHYVKEFLEKIMRDIYIKTDLRFQLPKPLFRNDGFEIALAIPSHRTDLSSIAYEGSRRLTLVEDREAFSTLKTTGKYRRGDFDLTFSWYPGRDKIKLWRMQAWAESVYQWTVQVPSALVGSSEGPSILQGVCQLVGGVGITCNRLTGIIPTWVPRYNSTEINEVCAREYISWLQTKGFKLTATEVITSSRRVVIGAKYGGDPPAPTQEYPAIFEHPERGKLDLRPYIPDIRHRLNNVINDAKSSAARKMGSQRMVMITSMSSSLGEMDASDAFLQAWHGCLLDMIEERRNFIDKLSMLPDLTAAVLDDMRAQFLVARFRNVRQTELNEAVKRAIEHWEQSHPLKATSETFARLARNTITCRIMKPDALFVGASDILINADLYSQALLLETQDEFSRSEILLKKRTAMTSARKAATIEIPMAKLPMNWTVKQARVGERTLYSPDICHNITIRTSLPFWRLSVLFTRYFTSIWNATFWLVNRACIGIRRWDISRYEFYIRLPDVDEHGHFRTKDLRTIRGRLAAVLEWRNTVIVRAQESEHIIRLRQGMYLDTCWAHFWTAAGVGVGSLATTCFTILETIGSVGFAALGLVTAPVWSLVANLGRGVYTALIYDNDLPAIEDRRSPLLKNQFGVINLAVSSIRTLFHSLKGVGVAVFGEARHLWNRLWHGTMTTLLKRAEVPSEAEGFFWSTSGPGMKTPFVLIDSDTATLALLAYLSMQELSVARAELINGLQQPRRDLGEQIRRDSAGAMNLNDLRCLRNPLTRIEGDNHIALGEYPPMYQTEREYSHLLSGLRGNSRIRMKEEELSRYLSKCVPLVKKFYIERYFPRQPFDEVVQFWEQIDLPPGDWTGLANHIASSIFTKEIIVPFEAASDDLVVNANQMSGLEMIVKEALQEQGVVTGLSTETRIGNPIQLKSLPTCPDYFPLPIRYSLKPTKAREAVTQPQEKV